MIKISKIFGDFVPRDSSLCQGLLPSIRHFENRRGEGPGDEVASLLSAENNYRKSNLSAISFGWFGDFGKTLTIIQRSSQPVCSDKW